MRTKWDALSRSERILTRKWCVQTAGFLVVYSPIFLFASGDFRWVSGWVWMAILSVFMLMHPVLLIPINPSVLVERARGVHSGESQTWDVIIVFVFVGLFPYISQFIGALDHRFSWSPLFPNTLKGIGIAAVIHGFAIFLWAMAANAFFAEGVRIQAERSHKVCDRGPYRFIRHPGYSGSIIATLFLPFLLGSIWALIPAFAAAAGNVARTILEDKFLMENLPGYPAYARAVRSRLIPYIF